MTENLLISVQQSPIQVEIAIGRSIIQEALCFSKQLAAKMLVITSPEVERLLPPLDCETLVLSDGESIKSRAIKEKIEDALIERGIGKKSCLVAIGGGTILDLVGFVAATYCRGIPYISIPTTLLAMHDAAIGGKTGVNAAEAKNWIGAFHHPTKIFIDLNFLETLPAKEYWFGWSEAVKHSLIGDCSFFDLLEKNWSLLKERQSEFVRQALTKSIQIKKEIVEQDPFETKGLRRTLNFGHTIGHALETLSNYTLPHGEAVVYGMHIEAAMAFSLGYLSKKSFQRVVRLLDRFPGAQNRPENIPFEMLRRDKKGDFAFVVLTQIGSVAPFDGEYVLKMTEKDLQKGLSLALCSSVYC